MRSASARSGAPLARASAAVAAALLGSWAFGATDAAGAAAPQPFVISGDVTSPFFPGADLPLNLSLFNPNGGLLTVTSLQVRIDSVQPVGQGTCTVHDFTVENLVLGSVPVPAGVTGLLSDLGVGLGAPRVRMLDSSVNQDGCKRAVVNLVYDGQGLLEETGGGATPTPGHGSNHDGDSGDGDSSGGVEGEHAGLPGTGADNSTWWIGLAGVGLAAAGTTAVRIVRRSKGHRS
jgi:LPXTG-motif cell wall-anchored protein